MALEDSELSDTSPGLMGGAGFDYRLGERVSIGVDGAYHRTFAGSSPRSTA